MPNDILATQNLARHLELKTQHDHWERLFHASRDAILLAMQDRHRYAQDGYLVLILEQDRRIFRHKLLALDYPDLHEQFLETIHVRQLKVVGPEDEPSTTEVNLGRPLPKGYVQSLIEKQLGPEEELLKDVIKRL